MTETHQRLCVRIGLAFLPLFWLGLLVAGWFPPPTPDLTVAEVQQMFAEDRMQIRIGVLILTSAAPLLAFFGAALTHQIRRSASLAADAERHFAVLFFWPCSNATLCAGHGDAVAERSGATQGLLVPAVPRCCERPRDNVVCPGSARSAARFL